MIADVQSFLQGMFDAEDPLISLIVILTFIVIAIIVHFITFRVILGIAKRSDGKDLEIIVQKLRVPSLLLFVLFAILIALPMIDLDEGINDNVMHALSIFIIIVITWFLVQGIGIARKIILKQYDIEQKDNLKARKVYTQFRMLERIIIFLIILIAVATALMTFEKIRQIGVSILASAGIAGIILGFAAQRLIATILAGFQIAITQPVRIEDVVVVEGEFGWIEEITLTYAVVRIWDKRRLIVPTTYFIENPFQNWTRVSSEILGAVYLYVDYSVNVEELRKELSRLLEKEEKWGGKVAVLQVTNSSEKTLELRALMDAADAPSAWDLRVSVRESMIKYLQEKYPGSLPKARVKLEKEGSSPKGTGPGMPS